MLNETCSTCGLVDPNPATTCVRNGTHPVVQRPKAGDKIRFALRYGSAPATVVKRHGPQRCKVLDHREGHEGRVCIIPDVEVVYINGKLTGNVRDDE